MFKKFTVFKYESATNTLPRNADIVTEAEGKVPATPKADEICYGWTHLDDATQGVSYSECMDTHLLTMGLTCKFKKVPAGLLKAQVASATRHAAANRGGFLSRKEKAEIKTDTLNALLNDVPADIRTFGIKHSEGDTQVFVETTSEPQQDAFTMHFRDVSGQTFRLVTPDSLVSTPEQEEALHAFLSPDASVGSKFLTWLLYRNHTGTSDFVVRGGTALGVSVQEPYTLTDSTEMSGAEVVTFKKGNPLSGKDMRECLVTKEVTKAKLLMADAAGNMYSLNIDDALAVSGLKIVSETLEEATPVDKNTVEFDLMASAWYNILCLFEEFLKELTTNKSLLRDIKAWKKELAPCE
jgi:hypothetical protein